MPGDAIQIVRAYHERTKHGREGYARGPEYIDWQDQPDPFRRYRGSRLTELPLLGDFPTQWQTNMDLANVAALLELSMGLSAWKQYGPDRWSLRCNPSSGNLHPTESYVITGSIAGLSDGVYHYAPHEHSLERRAHIASANTQPILLIGLSSIIWREAWKYGERAFRYVQLDVGHAIGAIGYAARALGLGLNLLSRTDTEIAQLLGIDREQDFIDVDHEHADILLAITTDHETFTTELPAVTGWTGTANTLGGHPRHSWSVLDEIAVATLNNNVDAIHYPVTQAQANPTIADIRLMDHIRHRRSAQAYRGKAGVIESDTFFQILQALLAFEHLPLSSWPQPPLIHPVLMLHSVNGLEPGLYILPRNDEAIEKLKQAMSAEFLWQPANNCPDNLPLFLLQSGDVRKFARAVSCHQEIAASSAFTLGMISEFEAGLGHGPHVYRQLYREAGLLGQVLYLQAESAGLRGTGIGCFFDEVFHEMLQLNDSEYQSLYHFCVGVPVEDTRLQTLPPYEHLSAQRIQA